MKIILKTLIKVSSLVAILGLYSCDDDETVQTVDCPEFTLEQAIINEDGSAASYTVVGSNEDAIYEWTVNDEVLTVNDNTSTVLEYTFPDIGDYTICVTNINTACSEVFEQCVESTYDGTEDVVIIIEDPVAECEISFASLILETSNASASNYVFEAAALDSESNVRYEWTVTLDGQDEVQDDTDATLNVTFTENGEYEVCVFAETPECPNGVQSCDLIVIDSIEEENDNTVVPNGNNIITIDEGDTTALYTVSAVSFEQSSNPCFDLTYDYTIEGNSIILEVVDFDGIDDHTYVWSHGDHTEPLNEIGQGRTVEFEFRDGGSFTFCVYVEETPQCVNRVSYCGVFSVDPGIIVNN